MQNLQLGPLVLNMDLLIYLLAGITGVLAVRLRSRGQLDKEQLLSYAWNTIIIWMIIWKASLLLFDPMSVISYPQALLFFDGGSKGFWLATVVAISYISYRYKGKLGNYEAAAFIVIMLSGWTLIFSGAQILLTSSTQLIHYVTLLLSFVVLLLLQNPTRKVTIRYTVQLLSIAFVIGLIGSMVHDQIQEGIFSARTSTQLVDEENQAVIGIRNGQSAPNFQLMDLHGNSVNLADYRGQKVIINFWTTWCRVCKAEMPHVEKLYEHYKNENVAILSVNVTSQESNAGDVEQYVEERLLSFPIIMDEIGSVSKQYKVAAYPTTFILDEAGIIRKQQVGAISFESMKNAIQDI
ncbi:MAG: TlpA family protein disulfide reductase [Candidatus Pristimantibacillus lignocellulolyticus]|uniref:TlpA family protein disulfide reductase n=1 Tax=Candidatus Pristimantibacillus lignocellulolyticus TaxID=2994561 RepID=A0A9J6ZEN2_9BACL|nr:MAG: TlpA family protein disulfide reductase [Candidatus Pristimantibacillus lignocellulolyticus]